MAKLIYPEGLVSEVHPQNSSGFTAEELEKLVEGYFQFFYAPEFMMIFNEEGWRLNLPFNFKASSLIGQKVVGNALICSVDEIQ